MFALSGCHCVDSIFTFCFYRFWQQSLRSCNLSIFDISDRVSKHILVYDAMCTTSCICLRYNILTKCKLFKNLMHMLIVLSSYFLIFVPYCQDNITVQHELYTKNISISIDHLLCNIKHSTLLIISPTNISRYIILCHTFGITKSSLSLFILLVTSPYLFFFYTISNVYTFLWQFHQDHDFTIVLVCA